MNNKLLLVCLFLTEIALAQQRYLMSAKNEYVPLKQGESAVQALNNRLATRQSSLPGANSICGPRFTFSPYPPLHTFPNVNFPAIHKDVMAEWLVVPATGTIDTIFWRVYGSVGALDSTVYTRIHRSRIGPTYGPGANNSNPFRAPTQCWGYYINTSDNDRWISPFIDDATDTNWVSTVNGALGDSATMAPTIGTAIWGGILGVQVKQHFSKSEDSFEIITDIETRIAEMFNDLLKKESRQVIFPEDVKNIIAKMGNVGDFEEDNTEEQVAENETIKARLFRHPDDKVLGGVCGGIAAYFDFDPLWLRLAWIASMFFFGIGLFSYIILWIVIPKARNRAEKLAMKGKQATLSNIKESVQEEINEVKRQAKNAGSSPSAKKARNFIENLVQLFFEVIGKIIGIVFIVIGSAAEIGLLIALTAFLGLSDAKISPAFLLNLVEPNTQPWISICFYLLFALPFLALILLGIRLLIGKSYLPRFSGLSIVGIWIIALIASIGFGVHIAASFKEKAKIRVTDTLIPSKTKTYYLKLDRSGTEYTGSHFKTKEGHSSQHNIFIDSEDFDKGFLSFHLEKSATDKVELEKVFSARGQTMENAISNAELMTYTYTQQDSVITFSSHFDFDPKSNYRAQELNIILHVPEGSKLIIDAELRDLLEDYWDYDCEDFNEPFSTLYVERSGIHCLKEKNAEKQEY